jgi:uncharacterized membrane protein YbhN (UPF0104 family)
MFEMLALYVGYFMFESDANSVWWLGYWAIVGLKTLENVGAIRKELKAKAEKEVEEARIYWEGKDGKRD